VRVLWLSHIVPYPPTAGNARRSFSLIRELSRRHEILLLAFNQRALLPLPEQVVESATALARYCRVVETLDVPYDRSRSRRLALLMSNLVRSAPYSAQAIHSIAASNAIKRAIVEHSPHVVHCDTIELAAFRHLFAHTPRVLNHHNIESHLLGRRAALTRDPLRRSYLRLQTRKLRRYEMNAAASFTSNLVVSDVDEMMLKSIAPGCRVEIIPNGVDTDVFVPTDNTALANNLVFVGSLRWFPNHDAVSYFLHEIWPLVMARLPSASLRLVGSGDIALAGVPAAHQIQRIGHVADVRPYLSEAAAVIVPLRVGGGTRLKILEALACGKAVISTTLGAEGLPVLHERDILLADSPREFVSQIIRVCTDPALRRSLGLRGRRLVEERFSWQSIGEKLEAVLASLATQP
jgi:polysaccharide biosynthesis protein PslH